MLVRSVKLISESNIFLKIYNNVANVSLVLNKAALQMLFLKRALINKKRPTAVPFQGSGIDFLTGLISPRGKTTFKPFFPIKWGFV